MARFVKYCATCGQLFVNEEAYFLHLKDGKRHIIPDDKKQKKEEKKATELPQDDGADKSTLDKRLENTMSLRELKKALRKAGIDCNTMNEEEAREAYLTLEKEKKA